MTALDRKPTDSFSETMMLNTKAFSATLLCLLGTSAAFGQQGPGPNPPANVYNDYQYEFFTLPKGASGNLTVINNRDVVAGTYYPTDPCCATSASGMGYVRYPDGKIVIFTIPNATAVSMTISGLNDRGELLGHYTDKTTNNTTGFIRYPDGKIETLALGGATESTIPTSINSEGNIFGVLYNNTNEADVPFLRYPDGQYLTFGVADATAIQTQNINDRGVALGSYFCPNSEGGVCGFYGKPGGNITTFSYPPNGMIPFEINKRGVIAGVAFLAPTGEDYFIRKPDGKMILFGLNKIANFESIETDIISINDEDEAIGAYSVIYEPSAGNSGSSYSYDFIRTPDGKISYYDPPNSPGTLLGDVISNRGVIAGRVVAPSGNGLFLLTPKHCK
jgi:hypothetical protein